jgi:hypothetical protein
MHRTRDGAAVMSDSAAVSLTGDTATAIETPTIQALRGVVAALEYAAVELDRVQAALHTELPVAIQEALPPDIQCLDGITQCVAGTTSFTQALIGSLETGRAVVPALLGNGIPRDLLDRLLLIPDVSDASGDAELF